MKMINGLAQELKKTIFSYGFFACVLISVVMFMQTNIYTDPTGKMYSVMESVFIPASKMICQQITANAKVEANHLANKYAREYSLTASVYSTNACFERKTMFLSVLNSSTMLFVPIIVSFPFVPVFCSERRSGLMRFTITRMGKMRYYFMKYSLHFWVALWHILPDICCMAYLFGFTFQQRIPIYSQGFR